MKIRKLLIALAAVGGLAGHAQAAVSISIGDPGFFGQLDFGSPPPQPPELLYPNPVVIQAPPPGVRYQPVYMHVPPAEAQSWGRYCGRYNACGRPVYFVQDRWYNNVYTPHYRNNHHPAAPRRDERRDDHRDDHHDRH